MPKKKVVKVPSKYFSIDEIYLAFIGEKVLQGKTEKTINNYNLSYRLFKEYNDFTGKEQSIVLDKVPIYNFIAKCKSKVTMKDGVETHMSVFSINHYLRDIRAFYYYCFENEQGGAPFKIKLIETQEQEPKFYTEEEVQKLLKPPVDEDNYVEVRTWVIVNFICATGARIGTICSLEVGDIDLVRNLITYRHTKNKKYQSIPITPALIPILKKYVSEWRDGEQYLFVTFGDEPLTENANRLAFDRYCEARGITSRGCHQLRHSFSRMAVLKGMNPFQLMTALGHYDIAMSKKYCRIWGEDLKEGFAEYTLLDTIKQTSNKKKKVSKK